MVFCYAGLIGATTGRHVGIEEFKSYLPVPVFEAGVTGNELAGVNGGGGVRVIGVVDEGGLGVAEHRAYKHREGLGKLLGRSRA